MDGLVPASHRTKTACDQCRKNKRKCDGDQPACALCQKGLKTCIYTVESQKRKRQIFDANYVKDLEEQVKTLTQLVDGSNARALDSAPASKHSLDSGLDCMVSSQVEVSFGRPLPSEGDDAMLDTRSVQAMEELGSMMLRLGLGNEGEPNFTIATSENHVPRSNKEPYNEDQRQAKCNSRFNAIVSDTTLKGHLIERFYNYFNRFHQLIDADEGQAIATQDFSCLRDDVLFRNMAVLAIGALYSEDPDARAMSQSAADTAEDIVLRCLKFCATPLVIQGLTLMSWLHLMLGNDMASWNFNSSATGLILRLGLHVTALSTGGTREHITVEQLEIYNLQVRTFWSYFSIDRIITATLGMNCTIPWQRVRVKSFTSIVTDEGTLDERAFSRQGELWHLWDSFMDQMYAFDWSSLTNASKQSLMSRSYKALLVFYEQSHTDLRRPPLDATDSVICFQLAYHVSVLLLYRPFLGVPDGNQTRTLALQGATAAALAVCRILREYRRRRSPHSLPPQTMSYIVCAAVIHLLNATSGRTDLGRRSTNNLKTCMDALLVVGDRWKSRKDTSIKFIRKLAHKWKVVWALPLQFSAPLEANERESLMEATLTDQGSYTLQILDSNFVPYVEASDFAFEQLNLFPDGDALALEWPYVVTKHSSEKSATGCWDQQE